MLLNDAELIASTLILDQWVRGSNPSPQPLEFDSSINPQMVRAVGAKARMWLLKLTL